MTKSSPSKNTNSKWKARKLEHEDFASILNLADTNIEKAIQFWLDAIPPNVFLEDDYIDAKVGQLEKLKLQFQHTKESNKESMDSEAIENLISIANLRLKNASNSENPVRKLIEAFFEGASDPSKDTVPNETQDNPEFILLDDEEFLDNDTRDLRRMEQIYSARSSEELYLWARRGYDNLTHNTLSPIRAYAPLRLYNSYDVSEQLAGAYRIAKKIGLVWADKLVVGCLNYLNSAPVNNLAELQYQKSLWYMMALTQPSSMIIPTARNYVLRLNQSRLSNSEAVNDALNSVLKAVGNAAPATSASTAFFEFVHRMHGLNKLNMLSFLRCWVAEQKTAVQEGVSVNAIRVAWDIFAQQYQHNLMEIREDPAFELILSDIESLLNRKLTIVPPNAIIKEMIGSNESNQELYRAKKLKDKLLHSKSVNDVREMFRLARV